jgi:hypothetical protein
MHGRVQVTRRGVPQVTDLVANPNRPDQFEVTRDARDVVWLLRMIGPDGEEISAAFAPEPGVGPGAIADGFAQHGIRIIHMIPAPTKPKQGGSSH